MTAAHSQTHGKQHNMALYINYLTKEIMVKLCCSRFLCRTYFTAPQVIPSKDSYFILLVMLEFKLETC